jgi:hypothetical protein
VRKEEKPEVAQNSKKVYACCSTLLHLVSSFIVYQAPDVA